MKKIFSLFYLMICLNLFSQVFNDYKIELLTVMENGSGNNDISYYTDWPGDSLYTADKLIVGDNNKLYLHDRGNYRFIEYDQNMKFLRSMSDRSENSLNSNFHYVTSFGNIYVIAGLVLKNAPSGKLVVSNNNDLLYLNYPPKKNQFFGEYFMFYDNFDNPMVYTPDLSKMEKDEVLEYQRKIRTTSSLWQDEKIKNKLDAFLDKNRLFYFEDRLYATTMTFYWEYFKLIQEVYNFQQKNMYTKIINDPGDSAFIGYDIHNNIIIYFGTTEKKDYYGVFNKYGLL